MHVGRRGQVRRGVWWGTLTARDHLENIEIDGNLILKPLQKYDEED